MKIILISFLLQLAFVLSLFTQDDNKPDYSYRIDNEIVQADSLMDLWQWDKAIKIYQNAQVRFEKESNWGGYYYCMNQEAECYRKTGLREKYIELNNTSIQGIKETFHFNHPELARAYQYRMYHFLSGENKNIDSSDYYITHSNDIFQKEISEDYIQAQLLLSLFYEFLPRS